MGQIVRPESNSIWTNKSYFVGANTSSTWAALEAQHDFLMTFPDLAGAALEIYSCTIFFADTAPLTLDDTDGWYIFSNSTIVTAGLSQRYKWPTNVASDYNGSTNNLQIDLLADLNKPILMPLATSGNDGVFTVRCFTSAVTTENTAGCVITAKLMAQ